MSATYTFDQKTGRALFYVSASTFHADYVTLAAKAAAAIEEEEAEEREWDSIVSKPHVRQALRRMAAEARRQYYAGETEEGGFGLE